MQYEKKNKPNVDAEETTMSLKVALAYVSLIIPFSKFNKSE
jgi:hypothetical protein